MNILEQINNSFENLNKSEKKVANLILVNPQNAIHLCIAALVKLANVSETTVNRLCRRMDTKGFPNFKLRLTKSLPNGASYFSRLLDQDVTVISYRQKVFQSAIAELGIVKDNLNTTRINRAIDLLTQIKKIAFFGIGFRAAYANIYMLMVSLLAQLTLIDMLATGFILRRRQNFRDNLKRVKDILHDTYLDKL
ncbi:hypothetical protein [Arsenophonus nasoniae]|uniref:HTH rpiR-type domain-containing protein n=1 Tax=Arsenophonus nasoniae TaxID=638 RepID=A0AA95GQ87_9GAMM|nr:hypothetical protein [Arsenophonus nasoniae]WGM02982.1 hypothetical protein QE210_07920 [Arsenophonus nasoniae]